MKISSTSHSVTLHHGKREPADLPQYLGGTYPTLSGFKPGNLSGILRFLDFTFGIMRSNLSARLCLLGLSLAVGTHARILPHGVITESQESRVRN